MSKIDTDKLIGDRTNFNLIWTQRWSLKNPQFVNIELSILPGLLRGAEGRKRVSQGSMQIWRPIDGNHTNFRYSR